MFGINVLIQFIRHIERILVLSLKLNYLVLIELILIRNIYFYIVLLAIFFYKKLSYRFIFTIQLYLL